MKEINYLYLALDRWRKQIERDDLAGKISSIKAMKQFVAISKTMARIKLVSNKKCVLSEHIQSFKTPQFNRR